MPPDPSDITWLFVEPQDVLLFRESRPFTAGESFWARSVFPPLSLPLMGALRSKAIVERGVSFDDYGSAVRGHSASDEARRLHEQIGGFDDYGPLRAVGPFPAQQDDRGLNLYFPLPANLAGREERLTAKDTTDSPVRLAPEEKPSWPGLRTNAPHGASKPLYFWSSDEPAGETEQTLLPERYLLNYLRDKGALSWERDRKLQERERRVGIALNARRTVREGLLYTVEFIRMLHKNFDKDPSERAVHTGFVIGLRGAAGAGLLDASSNLLSLGGERRIASYTEANPNSRVNDLLSGESVVEALEGRTRFLLYLATPAVFRHGWRPYFLKKPEGSNGTDRFHHTLGDLSFRLIAASAQKSTPLGGWDLGRGRPRTMYRAIPAGAVYVFETDDPLSQEQAQRLRKRFHFQTLHAPDPGADADDMHNDLTRLAQAGLGLTLLGVSQDR